MKAKKKWKIAFSMININEEESEWLTQAKEHWEKGGWTDRLAWLQAVMVEHRLLKATASSEAEADSQLRTLFYGIKAGRFINSMFSV